MTITISGVPENLKKEIENFVLKSNGEIRSVSHFFHMAANYYLRRNKQRDSSNAITYLNNKHKMGDKI